MTGAAVQFETKFYSSEFEWSFPAIKTLPEIIEHIEGYYPKLTLQYSGEEIKVLSAGEYIGTIKPAYPEDAKLMHLHKLLSTL